jgi:lipoic acid synthetase
LRQIKKTKEYGILSKSGFMLGMGESKEEVIELIEDLKKSNADILTIGQYLPPSKDHFPLAEFVNPEIFNFYKEYGISIGIPQVVSAPLVRSSYHSEQQI